LKIEAKQLYQLSEIQLSVTCRGGRGMALKQNIHYTTLQYTAYEHRYLELSTSNIESAVAKGFGGQAFNFQ
jgi:protein-tyrosine phosphatase